MRRTRAGFRWAGVLLATPPWGCISATRYDPVAQYTTQTAFGPSTDVARARREKEIWPPAWSPAMSPLRPRSAPADESLTFVVYGWDVESDDELTVWNDCSTPERCGDEVRVAPTRAIVSSEPVGSTRFSEGGPFVRVYRIVLDTAAIAGWSVPP